MRNESTTVALRMPFTILSWFNYLCRMLTAQNKSAQYIKPGGRNTDIRTCCCLRSSLVSMVARPKGKQIHVMAYLILRWHRVLPRILTTVRTAWRRQGACGLRCGHRSHTTCNLSPPMRIWCGLERYMRS